MKVGNRPSKRSRHGFTVSAESLMEEAARREMGGRIRELRERSPYKQHHMADRLSVGLRMYQRIEERGSTDWERIEQIAEIHDADPHWIWSGEEKPATPDLMRQLNGSSSEQLDRIEAKLDEILRNWDARWALLEADETDQETSQSAPRSVPGSASTERRRRVGG